MQNRKFEWCAHCKRWSTTHNTSTHTGRGQGGSGKTNPEAQANLSLVPDPSFWMARCIPFLPRRNKDHQTPLVVPVSPVVVAASPLVVPVSPLEVPSIVSSYRRVYPLFLGLLFTLQFMFSVHNHRDIILVTLQ